MPTRTRGKVAAARPGIGACAVVLGGFGLQPAFAQDSEPVTVDVGNCTELTSADARLACFGARVDAALRERGPAEVDERSAAVEDVDADRPANSAGEPASPQAQQAGRPAEPSGDLPAGEAVEEAGASEYSGTIVAVRERLPNAYEITLDDGQIWQQTEPKQYPVRPGLEVRIYPTRWGSHYRLHALGTGGHIQVRKIR